jgi:hypothetical protein
MNNEQTQADIAIFPPREKLWTERNQEEKLEALRLELLRVLAIADASREISHNLMRHVHGVHGEILVPIDGSNGHRGYGRNIPMSLRDKA